MKEMQSEGTNGPKKHIKKLALAGMLLVAALCWLCWMYLCERSVKLNADHANHLLQAQAILQGNVLLRGWWMTGFFPLFTDIPFYLPGLLWMGICPQALWLGYVLGYGAALVLAATLILTAQAGAATVKKGLAVLFLMATSLIPTQTTLFYFRIHFGTVPLFFLLLLLLQKYEHTSAQNQKRTLFAVMAALGTLGCFCDMVLTVCWACALGALGVLRLLPLKNRRENTLSAKAALTLAVICGGGGKALQKVYYAFSGALDQSKMGLTGSLHFVTAKDAWGNLCATAIGFSQLIGVAEENEMPFWYVLSWLRLLVPVLGIVVTAMLLYRQLKGRRADTVSLLLAIGYVGLMTICCMTSMGGGRDAARYFAGAGMASAVICGRWLLQNPVKAMQKKQMRATLTTVLLTAALAGIYAPGKAAVEQKYIDISDEISKRGGGIVYTGFWHSGMITLYSGGSVQGVSVKASDDGIDSHRWFADSALFRKPAFWLMASPKEWDGLEPEKMLNALGEPSEMVQVDGVVLLHYNWDISTVIDLHRAFW